MTDDLLTPAQAGRLLGISRQAVHGLSARGELEVASWDRAGRLYRRADVEALARARAARPVRARRSKP